MGFFVIFLQKLHSFKFYGNKKLWPYLVQHNKDIIKNADVVPVGTTIKIPELSPKADKK